MTRGGTLGIILKKIRMNDKIIPFGRHKGKPIEVLATDKQYMDWLLSQSWFKENHLTLYNVVINNFRENFDTPEHNKIQIKFLKKEQMLKLAFKIIPNLFEENSETINKAINRILDKTEDRENEYFIRSLKYPEKENQFGLYTNRILSFSKPDFERVDVAYTIWQGLRFIYDNRYGGVSEFCHQKVHSFKIEIKPTISDDFPAVLRQMKASMPVEKSDWQRNRYYILLVGNYTGTSATKEQFIAYFETQGYYVVFEEEIENLILPIFEIEFIIDKEIEEKIKHFT